jgi:hypothetical protein
MEGELKIVYWTTLLDPPMPAGRRRRRTAELLPDPCRTTRPRQSRHCMNGARCPLVTTTTHLSKEIR